MKGSNYLAAAVFTGWDFSAVPRQANHGAKGHQHHPVIFTIVIVVIIVVINIVWDILSLLLSGV